MVVKCVLTEKCQIHETNRNSIKNVPRRFFLIRENIGKTHGGGIPPAAAAAPALKPPRGVYPPRSSSLISASTEEQHVTKQALQQ